MPLVRVVTTSKQKLVLNYQSPWCFQAFAVAYRKSSLSHAGRGSRCVLRECSNFQFGALAPDQLISEYTMF